MISFGSDNHSGVHPTIFSALAKMNECLHSPSYGSDDVTKAVIELFKREFGSNSEVFFVFNGTAANVLSLSLFVESFNSVICSKVSHLNLDECGAPEKLIGCKLITIDSSDGKIKPSQIEEVLIRGGDQHFSQPRAVSITLPTEYGTCYTLDELRELRQFCKAKKLFLHIDGARLIHAAYYLKCTFKDIVEASGADVISFGGTKNGLLFGEAVIVLNSQFSSKGKYLRKQYMQLPSKMRFLATQFSALLNSNENENHPLWHQIAERAHHLALQLKKGLEKIKGFQITQEVQANSVFVQFDRSWTQKLKEKNFFYIWDEKKWEARLMISFDVSEDDINNFIDFAKSLK